jgi:uncharacterized protein YbgA (DUF1722 family)/uncharacterized protein YbbK (DUF523 family)
LSVNDPFPTGGARSRSGFRGAAPRADDPALKPPEPAAADDRPRLGISACLLGEKVRYDGGHKLDRYLRDTLGPFVRWVPVCPETECGLPIPRESMRLVGDPASPRLVGVRSGVDHTDRMRPWIRSKLEALAELKLDGFVFKTRSPSSGMRNIRILGASGRTSRKGAGLFAAAFMRRFPHLPVEDEARLKDHDLRGHFIESVFIAHRWRAFEKAGLSVRGLMDFHSDHKLLLMAHSPSLLRSLGSVVASARDRSIADNAGRYRELLAAAMRLSATPNKNTNVLQHAMGYFKKVLTADEKAELLGVIEDYHKGAVPLLVPLTLLNHYVWKYDSQYLKRQVYLRPHPMELMLRNHV